MLVQDMSRCGDGWSAGEQDELAVPLREMLAGELPRGCGLGDEMRDGM